MGVGTQGHDRRSAADDKFTLTPGVDSIRLTHAPSAGHKAKTGSSPQAVSEAPVGLFAQVHPATTIRPMSAKAAIHAPAQAAARSQLRRRQPRSRTNPAT